MNSPVRTDIQRCGHCRTLNPIDAAKCSKCGGWSFDSVTESQCPVIRELWLLYHPTEGCYLHEYELNGACGLVAFLSEEDARLHLSYFDEDDWEFSFEPVKVAEVTQ